MEARPPPAIPVCGVCVDTLVNCGGPCTLPCGHNFCLDCIAIVQATKPECPLCRTGFSERQELLVNRELRDLIESLAGPVCAPSDTRRIQEHAEQQRQRRQQEQQRQAEPWDAFWDLPDNDSDEVAAHSSVLDDAGPSHRRDHEPAGQPPAPASEPAPEDRLTSISASNPYSVEELRAIYQHLHTLPTPAAAPVRPPSPLGAPHEQSLGFRAAA